MQGCAFALILVFPVIVKSEWIYHMRRLQAFFFKEITSI